MSHPSWLLRDRGRLLPILLFMSAAQVTALSWNRIVRHGLATLAASSGGILVAVQLPDLNRNLDDDMRPSVLALLVPFLIWLVLWPLFLLLQTHSVRRGRRRHYFLAISNMAAIGTTISLAETSASNASKSPLSNAVHAILTWAPINLVGWPWLLVNLFRDNHVGDGTNAGGMQEEYSMIQACLGTVFPWA